MRHSTDVEWEEEARGALPVVSRSAVSDAVSGGAGDRGVVEAVRQPRDGAADGVGSSIPAPLPRTVHPGIVG